MYDLIVLMHQSCPAIYEPFSQNISLSLHFNILAFSCALLSIISTMYLVHVYSVKGFH